MGVLEYRERWAQLDFPHRRSLGGRGGAENNLCETTGGRSHIFYSEKILTQQAKSALQLLLFTKADKGLKDTPREGQIFLINCG